MTSLSLPPTGGPVGEPPLPAELAHGLTAKPLSPGRLALRRFLRHRAAVASLVVLVVLVLMVIFANHVSKYGETATGTGPAFSGPSRAHLFGTDSIGRDQYARVLFGGRTSLFVGIAVALVSVAIGAIIGGVAGFYGGILDNMLMRVTDLLLVIPLLVVLILATQLPARQSWAKSLAGSSGSVRAIVTLIAAFSWMPVARIVRGLFLSLKEKEFVEAARALGASDIRIMARHLLPNTFGQIIVNVTLGAAGAILTETTLSFLGYGVQPPKSTWGILLNNAKGDYNIHPALVLAPAGAVLVTVLAVNFLGDGLRDAFDPRQGRSS